MDLTYFSHGVEISIDIYRYLDLRMLLAMKYGFGVFYSPDLIINKKESERE